MSNIDQKVRVTSAHTASQYHYPACDTCRREFGSAPASGSSGPAVVVSSFVISARLYGSSRPGWSCGCHHIPLTPISEDYGECYGHKLCINFPCVRRDLRSLVPCNFGILVCRTVAGSERSALVKAMPHVDALLPKLSAQNLVLTG
jgi:hypothetical protein